MNNFDKKIEGQHRGLILLFTGNGKGKTTAAMGQLLRAWGHGLKVGVLQFIKNPQKTYGESLAAAKMGIPFLSLGDGFTWESKDIAQSKKLALEAWDKAQEWILSGKFDLLLLDEITYLFHFNWLDTILFIQWIREHKPSQMHIIISGRYAPKELYEAADLVTEMLEVKHPYHTSNLAAQKGIEY